MILFGNMMSMTGVPLGNFGQIGDKKFKNFKRYVKLYPEYNFVFLGDSGQGDAYAAVKMLKSKYANRIKAVFIHKVKNSKIFGEGEIQEWRQINFFDNYVEAANRAFQRKLIGPDALQRILLRAQDEFEKLNWENSQQKKSNISHFESACNEAVGLLEGYQEGQYSQELVSLLSTNE